MIHSYKISGLFLLVALPACAQFGTSDEDSLRRYRMPVEESETRLHPEVPDLNSVPIPLQMSTEKPWMDFDTALPDLFQKKEEKKVVLTLRPYSANTRYDWDPVYQKKIVLNKDTWRGEMFSHLYKSVIPSNWAKTPFDKGIRRTREEIEATGMRYSVTDRANNMAVGSWKRVGNPSGIDLMTPFTKDFWNPKARQRRERTLEVLRAYGDAPVGKTE